MSQCKLGAHCASVPLLPKNDQGLPNLRPSKFPFEQGRDGTIMVLLRVPRGGVVF